MTPRSIITKSIEDGIISMPNIHIFESQKSLGGETLWIKFKINNITCSFSTIFNSGGKANSLTHSHTLLNISMVPLQVATALTIKEEVETSSMQELILRNLPRYRVILLDRNQDAAQLALKLPTNHARYQSHNVSVHDLLSLTQCLRFFNIYMSVWHFGDSVED